MSREVRRVPLDFDWPLNKVWKGYKRPSRLDGDTCHACNGSGQTHFGWWLQHLSQRMGMLATDVRDQQRGKPMHPWLTEFPYPHGHFEYPIKDDPQSGPGRFVIDRPSPDALDFFGALMKVEPSRIDGLLFGENPSYIVMTKLLEITGVDVGCCECEGHGSHEKYPGQRADAEAWEPSDPPEGEGWQLWESVSEGSPISPVFSDSDGLASWMSDPLRGNRWVPAEVAVRFIRAGWAPSGMSAPWTNGLVSGVEAVGTKPPYEDGA